MCGEKTLYSGIRLVVLGSPPHVRGKACAICTFPLSQRITPACAGKRGIALDAGTMVLDHPRVCGEKTPMRSEGVRGVGSPPRVRGKERQQPRKHRVTRITPACAGKSLTIPKLTTRSWDHPRVCGEKAYSTIWGCQQKGSPPRVRGKDRSR